MPSEGSSPPPKIYLRAKLHRNRLIYDLGGGVSCQSHGEDCQLQPQIPTGSRRRAKFRRARRPGRLSRHRIGGTRKHSEGSLTAPRAGAATAAVPWRRQGPALPRPLPGCARLRRSFSAPTPPDPAPRHTPTTGGMSAPPSRRAALPAASDGRFMSGERDAGPAAASSPCPACCAPRAPGEVAGRRERGSGSAALPRGRRQRWPAAPGNGAEARSSAPTAGEQGKQETRGHSGPTVGFYALLPTPSRSPPPRRTRPDPTARRLPRRPRGSSRGSGTEPSVPGGGARRCPRSAPRRPGAAAAPPRSGPAPHPPEQPPAAGAFRRPGGLRRPGELCPCAAHQPGPPAFPRRPGRGAESPGKSPFREGAAEDTVPR